MNKRTFSQTVYVSDYTHYNEMHKATPAPYKGVAITTQPSSIISSFMLWNKNKIAFDAVNIECNPGLLKRKDGSLASQCECMFSAIRHDGGKPWMMLLELKYCLPKNRMDNVAYALGQLKKTYKFLRDEKLFLPPEGVKPYFVISTPDCEAIAPFEDCFLDQDELLSIKEDFDGAQVYHTNAIEILTAKHLRNKKE